MNVKKQTSYFFERHSIPKLNFGFGLIGKANNDITCHRPCCSIFFQVILWDVIFLGSFNTCKV